MIPNHSAENAFCPKSFVLPAGLGFQLTRALGGLAENRLGLFAISSRVHIDQDQNLSNELDFSRARTD